MKETNVQALIRLAIGRAAIMFRNNRGKGWIGKSGRTASGLVVIEDARRIEFGLCNGASDLIGWTPVTVTPEMVGKTVAIFTAIECKAGAGKPSDEQKRFIEHVQNDGGLAGVAWSEADALAIINNKR